MLRPGRSRRVASGFTLIEIAIALALVGILLMLGLPSFSAWIHNAQVRTVAEATAGSLRLAQAESVRRGRVVVLALTDANPELNATATSGGKNWYLQTMPLLGDEEAEFIRGGAFADVASSVSISADPVAANAVCFNSNGRLTAPADPGVPGAACLAVPVAFDFTSPHSDRPLRVTVAVGGQVRICDPNRPARSSTTPDGC